MTQALWYIRSGSQSSGPFPAAQIAQFVELGRLHPGDLISMDGLAWMTVEQSGQFEAALLNLARSAEPDLPSAAEQSDWERERALARKRWLDERAESGPQPPDSPEVRSGEPLALAALREDHAHTEALTRQAMSRRPAYWIGLVALTALLGTAIAVWYGQLHQPEPPAARLIANVDCLAVPVPEVGWQGCDKRQASLANANLKGAKLGKTRLDGAGLQGAELSYADLRGASLRGADLSGARLVGADLSEADLSGANLSQAILEYATLIGANLEGVRLSGARLGKASWVDGRLCAPQSLDGCG